jgi:hypothetical protein
MQAALLRSAFDEGSADAWKLILLVLPELRSVVISAGLPRAAESLLMNDLPHFYSAGYWDLNKRIHLSLSKLNAAWPDNEVLRNLALAPDELQLVLMGEERRAKNPLALFWPWIS